MPTFHVDNSVPEVMQKFNSPTYEFIKNCLSLENIEIKFTVTTNTGKGNKH